MWLTQGSFPSCSFITLIVHVFELVVLLHSFLMISRTSKEQFGCLIELYVALSIVNTASSSEHPNVSDLYSRIVKVCRIDFESKHLEILKRVTKIYFTVLR
jgi:hypothetical protein